MKTGLIAALAAASSLALAASAANANVTYLLDDTVSFVLEDTPGCPLCGFGMTVSGSITTDGHTGFLKAADIVGWDITIQSDVGTFSMVDKWPGDFSFVVPDGLFATSSGLFFDFGSDGHTGPTTSFGDFSGIGVNLLFEPGLEEVQYNSTEFGYPTASASWGQFGDVQIASAAPTPEPATWALMLAGFAGLGAALRTRRGQLA